ncbi:FAD:protein FMN transferase [Geminicoccus harenae]|uniref:FAD:protein FMN transferase n=1 Tax=Geminicoccus harenae TaxID=2498453 RepID=UPI00168B8214|nr:FAD:protein FMN transferase [Geminicoccus harenae]
MSTSRRRFITITAAAAGLPLASLHAAPLPQARVWRGTALGAAATMQIHHPDQAMADRLIGQSLAELERLERIFSLYRSESAVVRLNREGRLDDPPLDLVRLLAECQRFGTLTGGAFDVTVQPLWKLYAGHFAKADADPAGPPPGAIEAALALVGQSGLDPDPRGIRLARRGMQLTLNGIAQGYVTDRIVERLRLAGIEHALVDMGEIGAIGGHPDGGPWSAGLADPDDPARIAGQVALQDRSLATSAGSGTRLDPTGRFNHIFDPADGRTSRRYRSVSVVAANATIADAASTAFALMPLEQTAPIVRSLGLEAHFTLPDGTRVVQAG